MRDAEAVQPLNEWFRLRYAMKIQAIRKHLLEGVDPVLVRVGDLLLFFHHQQRRCELIHPPDYHAWKSLSHVPLAAYIWLSDLSDCVLTPDDEVPLRKLLAEIERVRPGAGRSGGVLLDATAELVERCLRHEFVTPDDLERMAERTRAPMRTLIEQAACAELMVLDAAVRRLTSELTSAEWSRLYVVICANHQARYKESTKLYFQRLLGEEHGQGAQGERQIVYSEAAGSELEAFDLLATHVFERELAAVFLGSPDAMQQDIQGDAAARVLDELFLGHAEAGTQAPSAISRDGAETGGL